MLAFADIFNLKLCEVFVQFTEFDLQGKSQDLIARDTNEDRKYKVDSIDIIEM